MQRIEKMFDHIELPPHFKKIVPQEKTEVQFSTG